MALKTLVILLGVTLAKADVSDLPSRIVTGPHITETFSTSQLFPFAKPFGPQRSTQDEGQPPELPGSPELLENPNGITHIYKHFYIHITPPLFLENSLQPSAMSDMTTALPSTSTTPITTTTTTTTTLRPSTTTERRVPKAPKAPKAEQVNMFLTKKIPQDQIRSQPFKIYIKTRTAVPYSFNDAPTNGRQPPGVVFV